MVKELSHVNLLHKPSKKNLIHFVFGILLLLKKTLLKQDIRLELASGFEPLTYALRMRRSTN